MEIYKIKRIFKIKTKILMFRNKHLNFSQFAENLQIHILISCDSHIIVHFPYKHLRIHIINF